jgi:hypothetical protein
MLRGCAATSVVGTVAATVAVLGAGPVPAAQAADGLRVTDYGFQATAYGTQVTANGGVFQSGKTAYAWLSCTRLLGLQQQRSVAAVNLPSSSPYISITGIDSGLTTFRSKAKDIDAGVRSVNTIGHVALGDGTSTPQLTIDGLETRSTVWADSHSAFHTSNDVTSGTLGLTNIADPNDGSPLGDLFDALNGGIDQVISALQANAGQIEIPGLGTVYLEAYDRQETKKNLAVAGSSVLRVDLYGPDQTKGTSDDSVVNIGHSRARINRNVWAGVMGGQGYGSSADLVDDSFSMGRLGEQPLPCRGTGGRVLSNPVADFTAPGDQFELTGISGSAAGDQRESGSAWAWTRGSVGDLKIGPLELKGIVGQVNLGQDRHGTITKNNIAGSTIGQVLVNGQSQGSFGPGDATQIPTNQLPDGVASIELFKHDKSKRSAEVTAVTVTFADGSPGASVLRLGYAKVRLQKQ